MKTLWIRYIVVTVTLFAPGILESVHFTRAVWTCHVRRQTVDAASSSADYSRTLQIAWFV